MIVRMLAVAEDIHWSATTMTAPAHPQLIVRATSMTVPAQKEFRLVL